MCFANRDPYHIVCPKYGNKSYDRFCTHCFANLFPDDPRTANIRTKSKELAVVAAVSQKFDDFLHDKTLWFALPGGCCPSKRRIDLWRLIDDTILAIEIDEDAHRYYDAEDEAARYNDLVMDWSGKYIFIRYNPDAFILGENKFDPPFQERMETLLNEIEHQIQRIERGDNTDLLEIHKLYYPA